MIVVLATLTLDAGSTDVFAAAAEEVTRHSVTEPGCTQYVFSRHLTDPTTFLITELWTTAEALEEHGRTDHFRAFRSTLKKCTVQAMSVQQLTVPDEQFR